MNHTWVRVLLANHPHIQGSKSKEEARSGSFKRPQGWGLLWGGQPIMSLSPAQGPPARKAPRGTGWTRKARVRPGLSMG